MNRHVNRPANRPNRRRNGRQGQNTPPMMAALPSHMATPTMPTVASPVFFQEMSNERYEPKLKRAKTVANLSEVLQEPEQDEDEDEEIGIPEDLMTNEELEAFIENQ